MTSTYQDIPISSLVLDIHNPRLGDADSQRTGIRAMLDIQREKLVNLAEHIVRNGLNPADPWIVTPSPEEDRRYVVLDGNRRWTALKLLAEPDLAEGLLRPKAMRALRKLGQRYQQDPVRVAGCVVFPSRAEAEPWIELRHTVGQGGKGLETWGSLEGLRFKARTGGKPFELQVLDFVRESNTLDDATRENIRDIPITSLERLVNDPYVREKLGIDKRKGHLFLKYPQEQVLPGLRRIIQELVSKKTRIPDIDTQEDRKTYIDGFRRRELPRPETALPEAVPLAPTSSVGELPPSADRRRRRQYVRKTVVPRGFSLNIDQHRLRLIFDELKGLDFDRYANAAAVLLRVFLELSIDQFMERNKLKVAGKGDPVLQQKMSVVIAFLVKQKLIDRKQHQVLRRAVSSTHLVASSIRTLHEYVHNEHFNPDGKQLILAWEDLRPLFEKIWS